MTAPLWVVNDGHNDGMPHELSGAKFEVRFRNGQTARYPAGGKARWSFRTNSATPFDIIAYRLLTEHSHQ